jgi:hypothetical protein
VLCRAADERPAIVATIAGYINQASDLFAEAAGFPRCARATL